MFFSVDREVGFGVIGLVIIWAIRWYFDVFRSAGRLGRLVCRDGYVG